MFPPDDEESISSVLNLPYGAKEPRSVKASNEVFEQLRSSCNGTEHTVAVILCNGIGAKLKFSLNALAQLSRKRHGEALQRGSTPFGARLLRTDCACGEWQNEHHDIAAFTVSPESLVKA